MTWLKRKTTPLLADIHSHLIPNIDDGSSSMQDSLEMLAALRNLGYKKIITTPHIHPKYPNSENNIVESSLSLRKLVAEREMGLDLEVAAEYYVDQNLIDRAKKGAKLLSFGANYILIECSYINKPLSFASDLFALKSLGYQPILAHPERYHFLEGHIGWLQEIKTTGLLFQTTLSSLVGYYGEVPRKIATELLNKGMVEFLASDLHKMSQVPYLKKALELKIVNRYYRSGKVINRSLI